MAVIGAPTDWLDLIGPKVPEILDLVISTWADMPTPPLTDSEDEITSKLWRALVQARDRRRLLFQIRTQVVELDPAEGADAGRMDIAFILLVPREDIYFCIECKRLNVPSDGTVRSYAAEYVRFGMARFITGQYAKAVRHGGMLGYVLDGDIERATQGIETNIERNRDNLGMTTLAAFLPSSVASDPRVRETHHHRISDGTLFRIHHIFVSAAVVSAGRDRN